MIYLNWEEGAGLSSSGNVCPVAECSDVGVATAGLAAAAAVDDGAGEGEVGPDICWGRGGIQPIFSCGSVWLVVLVSDRHKVYWLPTS